MRKFLIGLLILGCALLATFLIIQNSKTKQQQPAQQITVEETETVPEITDFPEPPPGAIVFDMEYRGLSGKPDEMRYNSYWGFGGNSKETPFLENLKKTVNDFETVYNPSFQGAKWSAIEIKDKKAVAMYIDLDANGKVSDNEKVLPIQAESSGTTRRTEFVTPDFIMNTRNNRQVPFRVLLQVAFYGQQERPNCMWSPSCVLEGTSRIDGQQAKLIPFTNGFFEVLGLTLASSM